MKTLAKNLLIIILIFFAVSALFSLFSSPFEKEKEIPLTKIVEDINQGKVQKITVSGLDVSVFYKDGTKAKSIKEPDVSLAEVLKSYGTDPDKLKGIEIEIKKEESIWGWLVPLIVYVLPFVIFLLFFWFMFRQAKVGATQVFSFTKAKARLFGAEGHLKERVTFRDVAGLKEAKEELKEIVDFLKYPKKYLQMGARIPRGVLLNRKNSLGSSCGF